MRFNKAQLEGFAKIADNVATACVVASIVGGLIEQKIGLPGALALNVIAVGLAALSAYFRKGEDDGN